MSTSHSNSQSLLGGDSSDDDESGDDNDEDDHQDDAERTIDESYRCLINGNVNISDETTVPKVAFESHQEETTASTTAPTNSFHENDNVPQMDFDSTTFMRQTIEIVAAKDRQIRLLQEELSMVMKMNGEMVEKFEKEHEEMKNESAATRLLLNEFINMLKEKTAKFYNSCLF